MPYDLVIRNGTVVDGTGAPPRRADVAVENGKVVAVGEVQRDAVRTIDAAGLVVAPGFIDQHTHYDAQICWDPLVTPSSWHGVTTVLMGNCGVGIAPCRPDFREIATQDLVILEGMPYDVLKAGVTWEWETFPEFMDAAEQRGSAINMAFLAPLTPFRHYVMGEASMERAATAVETQEIRGLLKEALDAGAFGFSTTSFKQHVGYKGRPLACRNASPEELTAYCGVLKDAGRGAIETVVTQSLSMLADDEYASLQKLSDDSGGRPIAWGALCARNDKPDVWKATLMKAGPLIERRMMPQVSPRPLINEMNLKSPLPFAHMDCWTPAFDATKDQQKALYAHKAFRDAFREELKNIRVFTGDWNRLMILRGGPAVKAQVGRSVGDIAAERGVDGVDAFLDLAIEDDLTTVFTIELFNNDDRQMAELVADPRIMISLSDGGAHADMLCDAGYATYTLGVWVREQHAMSLEYAVKRMTSEVADFWGIEGRGRLAPGMAADIVIFDPETVGSARTPWPRPDFPGGATRLVTIPTGVHYTIVNGEVVFDHLEDTGARPGRVLRSWETAAA